MTDLSSTNSVSVKTKHIYHSTTCTDRKTTAHEATRSRQHRTRASRPACNLRKWNANI